MKQELDAELSQLVRQYEERGLDPASIGDSLQWHATLATSRADQQTEDERVFADD